MSDFKVIILSRDSLKAVGLKTVLEESFGINAHIGDEQYISTFITIKEPHLFFIDLSIIVGNLSFFLPRKAKTIVLTNDHTVSDEFMSLCVNDNVSDIISNINSLLKNNQEEEKDSTSTLSQRETEVLRLIASGKINKEIAQDLNISINTVLSHRKNLTAKLGIKSISGLTFYAMMNGIV